MDARPRTRGALLAAGCFVTLSAASCAQGTGDPFVSGEGASTGVSAGGSSGSGGKSSAGASDAGSDAPSDGPVGCLHQSDCTGIGDACNTGDCLDNVCVKTPANEGGSCDDGLFCTDDDICTAGVCAGVPKSCTASDPCMTGSCDEASKSCSSMPGNDGTPCSLNNACFLGAACSGGVCTGMIPVDCSFLDSACSVGACDPGVGCESTPANDGTACSTNDFCVVDETCQGGACAGTPMVCPPLDGGCQINVCDSALEACSPSQAPDGSACSTTDICVTDQNCMSGVCVGGVAANEGATCAGAGVCTTNSTCDNGACTGVPVTACVSGDGCCPPGCTLAMDSDCNCSINLALTATAATSSGGSDPSYGPDQLNNGIGVSQCNTFSWILNDLPGAFFELDWATPVSVASIYVETVSPTTPSSCSVADPGRNVASADVDWWNGSAWVTAISFAGQTGNVQIDLPTAVTTTKLRLDNALPGSPGDNALIFEWHVFGSTGCIPPAD
jgi:hypothetical protein